jgi:hypothetical protein
MIPQSSDQWLPARVGKLTASRMADAMDFVKDGPKAKDGSQRMKSGAKRIALLHDLLAERLVGAAKDHYVTAAMQWGLDYEAEAALAYEGHLGNICQPGGFADHSLIENFGATPDRFVGSDGIVEIKCPTTATYLKWKIAGVVPEEHIPQMTAQLACTRRAWCDFVAYDPRLGPAHRLFVRRFQPSAEWIVNVEAHAQDFLNELDMMFHIFTGSENNAG